MFFCRFLRCGMGSRSSHISEGHGANTQPSAVGPMRPSNALTSTMMSAALSRFVTIWAGRTHQVQADPTLPTWHAWTTACKKISAPTHPTVALRPQKGRRHTSRVEREMSSQASCKATHRAEPPRDSGDLRQIARSTMWDGLRDQATSRGSWGEYSAISRKTNETKQRPNQHYESVSYTHLTLPTIHLL